MLVLTKQSFISIYVDLASWFFTYWKKRLLSFESSIYKDSNNFCIIMYHRKLNTGIESNSKKRKLSENIESNALVRVNGEKSVSQQTRSYRKTNDDETKFVELAAPELDEEESAVKTALWGVTRYLELPVEIMMEIFKFLSLRDLLCLSNIQVY